MDSFLKEIQNDFLVEAEGLLTDVESFFLILEKNPEDEENLHKIFRLAHNFKGSGRTVGFEHLAIFSHEIENLLVSVRNKVVQSDQTVIQLLLDCCDQLKIDVAALRQDSEALLDHSKLIGRIHELVARDAEAAAKDAHTPLAKLQTFSPPLVTQKKEAATHGESTVEEYIRLPLKKVEDLINSFGEQVILQSTLDLARNDLDLHRDLVVKTIAQLSKLTYDLQQTTMGLRMVSLKNLFSRIERAVRDAGQSLNKKIEFSMTGQDSELDKSIVESLIDPLTHMARNAVDHGIEGEADRVIAGKESVGKISMAAFHQGGMFVIEIRDDGKGLDPDRIVAKAISSGIIATAAGLSKKQIFDLIFQNGFSTKEQVSDISGRGVGMNVVLDTIQRLRGVYEIESEIDKGTCFRIRVPLTLAVFNGMIIRVGEGYFVTCASDIEEVVRANQCELRKQDGQQTFVRYKDQLFDLVDLSKNLGFNYAQEFAKRTVLLSGFGGQKKAFLIDELVSLQKIVHKKMDSTHAGIKGASGATILGDGRVALILDLQSLSKFQPLAAVMEQAP